MPAKSVKSTRASKTAKSQSYVKFSDKLTDSLEDISKMIAEHKEMIDTIQEVALELTGTFGSLHSLTVKYAAKANQILDILLPILQGIPIIPKKATNLLVELEEWTQKIIDNEKTTSKTIIEVTSGLRSGDVSRLKGHTGDLKKVTNTISSILPGK